MLKTSVNITGVKICPAVKAFGVRDSYCSMFYMMIARSTLGSVLQHSHDYLCSLSPCSSERRTGCTELSALTVYIACRYCPFYKSVAMLKNIVAFHELANQVRRPGAPASPRDLANIPCLSRNMMNPIAPRSFGNSSEQTVRWDTARFCWCHR